MKKLLLISSLFLSPFIFAQNYNGPESVEYDYANERWLIGNTTSHQVLARNSEGVLSVFATGLVSGPYGIEIVDDVLYCCSGSSIKGYALSTGTNVFTLNVGATFLNGLTHDNSGNLYATDFSGKKIYKINIASQTFSVIASSLVQSPNGIVFDEPNNRCVFVNWGNNAPIKAIDLTTNVVTTLLSSGYNNCDGISKDATGNYYISNWGNQSVVKFNSTFTGGATVVTTGLSSPADVFVNTVVNILGIPNSGNNTVTFFDLNTLHSTDFDASIFEKVSVYPNPITATSVLKYDFPNEMKLSGLLLDSSGKTINTLQFSSECSQRGEVSLATMFLNSGIYYLVISADDNSKTFALIVE